MEEIRPKLGNLSEEDFQIVKEAALSVSAFCLKNQLNLQISDIGKGHSIDSPSKFAVEDSLHYGLHFLNELKNLK